jgi:hypothetical protein
MKRLSSIKGHIVQLKRDGLDNCWILKTKIFSRFNPTPKMKQVWIFLLLVIDRAV